MNSHFSPTSKTSSIRVFPTLALAVGSLLATARAQACILTATFTGRLGGHHPHTVKVAAFTSPAVSIRPGMGVRPSFGGFHSTPAY